MFHFLRRVLAVIIIGVATFFVLNYCLKYIHENRVLKEVIERLQADSRAADVLVTGVNFDEAKGKTFTTIKFLEYDIKGNALSPKYFTFPGNIIQFQSLVIRFDDYYVRMGDELKGKSAYLFWKVFMLDGENTQEYDITPVNEIPDGYRLEGRGTEFEKQLWGNFWKYALGSIGDRMGVKNAQIEAPGTMFVPGMIYTIKIEHDGGLRIDAAKLPEILKGETIPE